MYHLLSLSRSEVLRGRATRIWLAWKYEDMEKVQKDRTVCHPLITYANYLYVVRQVHIFKDAWYNETNGLRMHILFNPRLQGPNVARVSSYSVVRISGQRDDTVNFIRDGIDHKRSSHRNSSFSRLTPSSEGPCNRIHTRIIREGYSLPLTRFRSLPEMLGVMRDAIQGKLLIRLRLTSSMD